MPDGVDAEIELDSNMSELTVSDSRSPVPSSPASPAPPVAKRSRVHPDSRPSASTTVTLLSSLIPIFDGRNMAPASQPGAVAAPGGAEVRRGIEAKDSGTDSKAEPSTEQVDAAAAASSSSLAAGVSSDSKPDAQSLAAMTFSQYFSYYLSAAETVKSRRYLYSEQQYMLLLSACSANRVSDMDISDAERKYI